MGACGDAPVLLRNNKHMLCAMSNQKIDELIEGLK
jgi:NADH:ubiquinone oxidoreductase subunit E